MNAHDAITLLGRTASGWRTDNARYQAASYLASELQTKVAALEARLANPTPDNSASKTSDPSEDPPWKLHNGAQRGGNTNPDNDQGPAATISTEGSAQNDFRLLSRLAPFLGNPADGEDFLNSFLARSRLCTNRIASTGSAFYAAPHAPVVQACQVPHMGGRMQGVQSGIHHPGPHQGRPPAVSALTQADDELVASYIARFERKLGNVDIKAHKDLFIDALFEGIRPILLISGPT